jgi:hypothetical protein
MKSPSPSPSPLPLKRLPIRATVLALALLGTTACGLLMGVESPGADAFGLGPRQSANGSYTATLIADQPIRQRQLLAMRVAITDNTATPVANATIAVDGGMPSHGHGLPSRPRASPTQDIGVYEIDGLRFNMGGWWELRLAIMSPHGDDTVTFNLDL